MIRMDIDDGGGTFFKSQSKKPTRELIYYRQNRKGKPLKISREKYLRQDISCGSKGCKICPNNVNVLDENPKNLSNVYKHKHYLLPDAGFIVRQLDILEKFENVILLQSTMEDVFHTSSNKYKRLRDGAKNKKCLYFLNEHHSDTYVQRKPNETGEERNRRLFIKSYEYFNSHYSPLNIKIIILSDDPNFKSLHGDLLDSVTVFNCEEYIHGIENNIELDDKLCRIPFNEDEAIKKYKSDFTYPPHLDIKTIQDGLKSGKYQQGSYRCINFYEGKVRLDGDKIESREILIQKIEHINRATDGDIVAIEIFDETKWSIPTGIIIENIKEIEEQELNSNKIIQNDGDDDEEQEQEQEMNETNELNLNILKENNENIIKKPTGKIIGIIRRKWLPCCGRIELKNNNFIMFIPDNHKLPRVRIETRNPNRFEGKKIVVQIDHWPVSSRNPIGHYLKILGNIGEIETETEAILNEYQISYDEWSISVQNCLPTLPYVIPSNEYKNRMDFRHLNVMSVDPPGCTDIDDALHIQQLNDGTFIVGVHIADVSHYVKYGSALDEEACKRGTSVYLADRRIDMIPNVLSSNIASLHTGIDKLVFSVIWKIARDATILETNFYKGIINSIGALTYGEAQSRLNSKQNDHITQSLKQLNYLAQILRKNRFENGALMLTSTDVNEDPNEEDQQEAHSLVEEFMLLANTSVAKFILNTFREYSLLRRHPVPPPANFEPLLIAAATHGIKIIVDNGSKILNESIEKQNHTIKNILRLLTTRCMTQALYCCSGTTSKDEFLHFGLAVDLYTHFTSPIRRYADLMVHRLLSVAIGVTPIDPKLMDSKRIHNICENINIRHRMAQYASRASHNIHKSRQLRGKTESHTAFVMFVRRNALQVYVPKYNMEGYIYYPKTIEYYYSEKNSNVKFENNIIINPLDQIIVQLSIEEAKDKVLFKLLTPTIQGF